MVFDFNFKEEDYTALQILVSRLVLLSVRGVMGFKAQRAHTAKILRLSEDLPRGMGSQGKPVASLNCFQYQL